MLYVRALAARELNPHPPLCIIVGLCTIEGNILKHSAAGHAQTGLRAGCACTDVPSFWDAALGPVRPVLWPEYYLY